MKPIIERTVSMRNPKDFSDFVLKQTVYSYLTKGDVLPQKRLVLPKSYTWEEFNLKLDELESDEIRISNRETYMDDKLYSIFRCFIHKHGIQCPFYQADYYNSLTDRTISYLKMTIDYMDLT